VGSIVIDANQFRHNQSLFPRSELERFDGQYVAWSPDGTSILAADVDPLRVDALLSAAGYDPADVLVSRIALPEDVSWGGWLPEDFARP
jgi:hypothetical protein